MRSLMRLVTIPIVAFLFGASGAFGQAYPSKPITLIVPFPPGGQTDVIAREVAHGLSQVLEQSVIVQNIGGAAGRIGAARAAKSPADGYTLLVGANSVTVVNMFVYKDPGYDTLRDFRPVSLLVQAPLLLLVHPSVPANSLQELIALAKSKPGMLTYASAGGGSTPHLAAALLARRVGIEILHIPYQGSGPAIAGLLGGQVSMIFDNVPTSLPLYKSGKVRGLAVSSAKRAPLAPDVPTVAESGIPGFEVVSWTGIFAPVGVPEEIIAKLGAGFVRVMQMPDVRKKFAALATDPVGSTPEEFTSFVRSEMDKWSEMVKAAGIKAE